MKALEIEQPIGLAIGRDRPAFLNLVLWILTVGLVIYLPKLWLAA